jgi:hypothetical protein
MAEIILGGLLTMAGGLIATYLQMRYIRKNKMEEVIAERKIVINAQAYSYMKEIEGRLIQGGSKVAYEAIMRYEKWFFESRLFLPGKFPEKWLMARNYLGKVIILENENKDVAKISKYRVIIADNVNKAIDEIYSDMDLEKIVLPKEIEDA